MKKLFIALATVLLTAAAHAQPVAETCEDQYTTLSNGRALEMDHRHEIICLTDMLRSGEEWSFDFPKLGDLEGTDFLVGQNGIFLISRGGTSSGDPRTIIQRISFDGELLGQIRIPYLANHVGFMPFGDNAYAVNSHDSLYLFTEELEQVKRVKGPEERINDIDVHDGHLFALVENSSTVEYHIVEFDGDLEEVDSHLITVDAPGCKAERIALNRLGEIFVYESWEYESFLDSKVVFRKYDASVNEVWVTITDTLYQNPRVFAPLDDGGFLVSKDRMINRIDSEGNWTILQEGGIGFDYETDSSYTFTVGCAGYQFSKEGDYLPWYHKVYIEHVEWYNPSGALCMPDPPTGVQIQLDAGYPGSEGGVTWSDGVTENPHVIYEPGAYYANFTFMGGNIGYTDTFVVEDHYALVDKPEFDLDYEGALNICQGTGLDIGILVLNDNGTGYTYEVQYQENPSVEFEETTTLDQEGSYRFTVTDGYGCFSDTTIDLTVKRPYAESLCMVSVDPVTEKNLIVWNKTPGQGTVSYSITRGYGHTEIGTADFGDQNYLVDQTSDPAIQAYRYFITSTDTCGNQVISETSHKTLHLTANVGTSGEVNLIWESYIGVAIYQYNFYRSTDGEQYELFGALEYDPEINQYSDYDHPFWKLYYKIGIVGDFSCGLESGRKSVSEEAAEIFSNAKLVYPTGMDASEKGQVLAVYPNPAEARFTVKLLNPGDLDHCLRIFNQLGALAYETTFRGDEVTIDLPPGMPPGMYYISVTGIEHGGTVKRGVLFTL